MPFPKEHAARQTDPDKYIRIRRENDKFSSGIDAIWGVLPDGTVELQSIRFDASKFTPEQARAWLKDHGKKTGLEPASGMTEEFLLEGDRLKVRLIREGVSKNGNRWTRKVIEQLKPLVDGVPLHFYDASANADGSLATHWEFLRQKIPPAIRRFLPERIPEAQVGVIRNPQIVEEEGVASLYGEAELKPEAGWFRSLLERLRSVGRTLGISIHVPEDGLAGKQLPGGGLEPEKVTRVVGFDAVTFPSAGGGFVPVLEALMEEEAPMKNLWKRLLRLVPKDRLSALEGLKVPETVETVSVLLKDHAEAANKLLEALKIKTEDGSRAAVLEALANVAPESAPQADQANASQSNAAQAGGGSQGQTQPQAQPNADNPELKSQVAGLAESVKKLLRGQSLTLLESEVGSSQLPKPLQEFTKGWFTRVLEAVGLIDATHLKQFITELKKGLGDATAAGGGLLEGGATSGAASFIREEWSSSERAIAGFDALLEGKPFGILKDAKGNETKVPAFRGVREAYGVLTGDVYLDGPAFYQRRRRPRGALEGYDWTDSEIFAAYVAARGSQAIAEATCTTATFPLLLSDRMHKRMVREYLQQDLQWQLIANAENVSDFKTWRMERFGEFPNLAVVAEDAAYLEVTGYPSEEEITLAIVKHGGLAYFSWEALVNDDLRKLRDIPTKLARAAARTLNQAVFYRLLNNTAIYDTKALAHVDHANITASAISYANLQSMRKKMSLQKDLDSKESGRVIARRVFVGPSSFDAAYGFLFSDGKPTLTDTDTNQAAGTAKTITRENERIPNVLRSKYALELFEVPYFEDVDADQYWVTARPDEAEMIAVGFFQGRQEPELFVQDLDRVGSFFSNERIWPTPASSAQAAK